MLCCVCVCVCGGDMVGWCRVEGYTGSGDVRESGEGAGTSRVRPRIVSEHTSIFFFATKKFSRAALRRGGRAAAPWRAGGAVGVI